MKLKKESVILVDQIQTIDRNRFKDKVDRKLLSIGQKLFICFISRGKWDEKSVEKTDENGWTLWKRRANDGGLSTIHRENLKEIIEIMLKV